MTGIPLIIAFVVAVVLMIVAISKWKVHPFLSIMGVSSLSTISRSGAQRIPICTRSS